MNVAMEIRSPTRRFINVDFPTFGLPTIFTKPDLCIIQQEINRLTYDGLEELMYDRIDKKRTYTDNRFISMFATIATNIT